MKKGWIYLLLLVILCNSSIFSQNQLLVIDSVTRKPIENVGIYSKDKIRSTVTNINGTAYIDKFKPGDTIYFQHSAYKLKQLTYKEIIQKNYTIELCEKVLVLNEFVFSVNKTKEKRQEVPHRVFTLSSKDLKMLNTQSSVDMIESTGKVMVQKSQMGGGSPVIRGFEANRILLVVDGIRINNAIFRNGHIHNIINIDPGVIDRVEVNYGPESVVYGSDAIGGMIHFSTKDPVLSKDEKKVSNIGASIKYSSAGKVQVGNIQFNLGYKKIAFFSALSYSNFNDLKTGTIYNKDYPDWGKREEYAVRINGIDSFVTNEDVALQKYTGYDQYSLLQKVLYEPNDKISYKLKIQYANSSDVPRYDMLTDYTDGKLKYIEWTYNPQHGLLSALEINFKESNKLYNTSKLILAYQHVEEGRTMRKFGNNNKITQEEQVAIVTLTYDLQKIFKKNFSINYGLDVNYNYVDSKADSFNILTEVKSNSISRYPDGGSSMQTYAAYITSKKKLGKITSLTNGIRYTHAFLNSVFDDNSFFELPYNKVNIATKALTTSIGAVFTPNETWQINLLANTGFRFPNVDDYGKIRTKNYYITIPNPDLKPEYAYNAEFSLIKRIQKHVEIEMAYFYTFLNNAIVRKDFTLNGKDSLSFDGDLYKIQSNANAKQAYVHGIFAELRAKLPYNLSLNSNINYIKGHDITDNLPFAHIPPLFGMTELVYMYNKWGAKLYSRYNGWKRIEDYSLTGEDNEDKATPDGTPSWYTINIQINYKLSNEADFNFGVENLLDHHYRGFGSGISAPGRNFVFHVNINI